MKIEKFVLRKVQIQLKAPFETSFARMTGKHFIALEVHTKDHVGYGDCSALEFPFYNEETIETAWHILEKFFLVSIGKY
mgnify:FL=1